MHWWPRQTPRSGISPASSPMAARLTPPSSGRPGPGEIRTASGRSARMPATSMASLRYTTGSAPSSPSSWTRL